MRNFTLIGKEYCTKTDALLTEDSVCWLELSNTDGLYYHNNIPVGHESQGWFPFTKEAAKSPNEYEWEYTSSSSTIWANFDHGVVTAYTQEEARELALSELKNVFFEANELLSESGLSVSFDYVNFDIYKVGTVMRVKKIIL